MARARAAAVFGLAVCCLLVATAPARRPVDLQPARAANAVALVNREAAAEPLARPVGAAVDCSEAADEQGATALAVIEEEDAARAEATSGGASALEVRLSSKETTTVDKGWGWGWLAVSGKAEDDERRSPYDSDSDSDCDSDSDDEDEGGVFWWLWKLVGITSSEF